MALSEAEKKELAALENEIGGLSQEEFQEMVRLEKEIGNNGTMGNTPSTASDFTRGVAQGATLGFGDELTGAVGAVLDPRGVRDVQRDVSALREEAASQDPQMIAAQMKAEGFSDEEVAQQLADLARFQEKEAPSSYDFYRDTARRLQKEAEKRSPIATGLGEATGAIGLGALTGAASIPAQIAEGAIYGLGGAEGTAAEQLKDAGASALISGGIAGIGKGAGALFDRAKQYLGGAAERQAVKALQATPAQAQKIFDEQRMGRALLDDDIVGAFRSPEKMAKAAKIEETKLARDLDNAYDAIGGPGISKEEIAQRVLAKADEFTEGVSNKPIVKKMNEWASDLMDRKAVLKPKDVRTQRKAVDNVTNFNSDAPTQVANQEIRDVLRRVEDEAFSAQGLGDEFVDLKRRFGDISDASRILNKSIARDKAGRGTVELLRNALLGGAGYGVGGMAGGGEEGAMLAIGANILNRKIGAGGRAKVLDRMSQATTPQMTPTINRLILSQDPYSP